MSCTPDSRVIDRMILDHFRMLRADARFKETFLLVFVETNSSWAETDRLRRMVTGDSSNIVNKEMIHFVVNDPEDRGRAGVRTTDEEKRVGADRMESALLDRTLRYAVGFFTATEKTPSAMKKKIEDQLQNYRREVKIGADIFSKNKVKWTGKGAGRKDDVCWVIQMNLLWSSWWRKSAANQAWASRKGWVI